jgi:hypothetical protein
MRFKPTTDGVKTTIKTYPCMYMNGKSLIFSCITRKYTRILLVIPLKLLDIAVHILRIHILLLLVKYHYYPYISI